MSVGDLVVLLSGAVVVDAEGRPSLPDKLLQGLQAYVDRWPGPVRLVSRIAPRDISGNLNARHRDPADLPFEVSLVDDPVEALTARPGAVVLAAFEERNEALLRGPAPVVFVVENSAKVKADYAAQADGVGVVDGLRIRLGTARRAPMRRRLARRSAGLQCQGWVAWNSYAALSPAPLLFFDTRLTGASVDSARGGLDRPLGRPVRFAFSGRWVRQKGVQHLVEFRQRLDALGVPSSLDLLGGGPLESVLRAELGEADVRFVGSLPFAPDWVEHVMSDVDLMVLPHTQGDSSSTYLESIGLGVPVLGFPNDYLRELVRRHGVGWVSARPDGSALAQRAADVLGDADEIAVVRRRGIDLMGEHSFEREFDRRVEHMLQVTSA